MIIPIVAFRLSFSFFMLYPAFKEFPKELEEAAELDGCGKLRFYWSVLIPVCKPAVIAVALLNLVYAWNEFTFSINFVSDEYFYTIPIGIMSFSQALYKLGSFISRNCIVNYTGSDCFYRISKIFCYRTDSRKCKRMRCEE